MDKIVHISENDRSTPGQEHVAWDETFDAIRKTNWDGWMVVEAFDVAANCCSHKNMTENALNRGATCQ